ncbi:hypothetical protein [Hymenobacter seoulensis]
MQTLIFRRHGWAFVLLLLTSCRSEQVAFRFSTAPSAHSASSVPSAPRVAALAGTPVASAASVAPVLTAPAVSAPRKPTRTRPRVASNPWRRLAVATPRPFLRPRAEVAAQPAASQAGRDTFHLVLGFTLVAAGVVAGLLLGGWLGLGVGALVVILGYYFVILGLGGKHAWLEIFQEFFNM